MKALTPKMIEVLMECHEREILGQEPCPVTIPYATGLITREMITTKYFTNGKGKAYLAIHITDMGKRFLEDLSK